MPILFTSPRAVLINLRPAPTPRRPGGQHHQILAHLSTAMPNRMQRLHRPVQSQTWLASMRSAFFRLRRFDPFHQPRLATSTSCPHSVITSCTQAECEFLLDHYPRHCQCLKELPYIFLRCPQLSFGQRFSLQTKNAVLTPAVPQIHSHRQTIEIGPNRASPAIFFFALVVDTGASNLSVNLSRTSASTSFASRCTGPSTFCPLRQNSHYPKQRV